MTPTRLVLLMGALAMGLAGSAEANLSAASIFGDHMVLQRDGEIPVWGTASPGAEVTASLGGKQAKAQTNSEGNWTLKLPAMPATSDPKTLSLQVTGGESIQFEDVLIGDVWACSGQSNMAWPLSKCLDSGAEIAAADLPQLRLNRGKGWAACSPETAGQFSGVAYYFGRKLHQDLKIPVGLVQRAVGGTPVEFWTPAEKLTRVPFAKATLAKLGDSDLAEAWQTYKREQRAWSRKAKKDGKEAAGPEPKAPGKPGEDVLLGIYQNQAVGKLWKQHWEPVVPFRIRGAIWYQGERNSKAGAEAAAAYRPLLGNMITSWREAWNQGDFPFLVVQLPTFAGGSPEWAVVQEAQAAAVRDVPAAGYVDIRDLKDGGLHPKEKKPVGERLAALAQEKFLP